MTGKTSIIELPSHFPEHLFRECALLRRDNTVENPFQDMISRIHEEPEIFWSQGTFLGPGPVWVPRRYRDLRSIFLDALHFSNRGLFSFAELIDETWLGIPVELDPPLHEKFRALFVPVFAPGRMAALEGRMREAARAYIAAFRDRGECELMADFAFPFPVTIFLELMGLPPADMLCFLSWEKLLLHGTNRAQIAEAVRQVKTYLLEAIEDRRARPKDDLISYGLSARIDGRPLTEDELIGYTFTLFVGGLDTISSTAGLHFRHLAETPADQEMLRADPGLIAPALDELMRAYGTANVTRTCVGKAEMGDVVMMPGDKVVMSTTLAGRDPGEFDEPSRIDFTRRPPHISFGYGPHLCLGVHLARRELRIALEEFLAAVPAFRLKPGTTIETTVGGVIQPLGLPLVWEV